MQHKRAEDVEKRGGAEGLAAALHTDLRAGLPPDAKGERGLDARRAAFGANRFKEVKPRPFFRLLLDNLRDPTLILLMVAAAVRHLQAQESLLLVVCTPEAVYVAGIAIQRINHQPPKRGMHRHLRPVCDAMGCNHLVKVTPHLTWLSACRHAHSARVPRTRGAVGLEQR